MSSPYKRTWSTNKRVDFTFSLENKGNAEYARQQACRAIETMGGGWTHRDGLGGWEGGVEHSHTLSLINPSRPMQHAVFAALVEAGCEAVQVESWLPEYVCEEWRAS